MLQSLPISWYQFLNRRLVILIDPAPFWGTPGFLQPLLPASRNEGRGKDKQEIKTHLLMSNLGYRAVKQAKLCYPRAKCTFLWISKGDSQEYGTSQRPLSQHIGYFGAEYPDITTASLWIKVSPYYHTNKPGFPTDNHKF